MAIDNQAVKMVNCKTELFTTSLPTSGNLSLSFLKYCKRLHTTGKGIEKIPMPGGRLSITTQRIVHENRA
jgi:hypothetical protein